MGWRIPGGGCLWISHKYKFIGIKFAKTGGSSIIKALKGSLCGVRFTGPFNIKKQCPDKDVLDHGQHIPDDCTNVLPSREIWKEYLVFTFVRNPFSRRTSMVRYCNIGGPC